MLEAPPGTLDTSYTITFRVECLSFSVPPEPTRIQIDKAFFLRGEASLGRFRFEIGQHSYCFEKGKGDRADCHRSKERKTPSPPRLVRAKRERVVAAACHRHGFSVVQEHPSGSPGEDPLKSTNLQWQTSYDNRKKAGRRSYRVVQGKLRSFRHQKVLPETERRRHHASRLNHYHR